MSILAQMIGKVRPETFAVPSESGPEQVSRKILAEVFGHCISKSVAFRLWDGSLWPNESHGNEVTVVLNRPSALREMFLPGSETGIGEAYLRSAFDIEGNIEAAFEIADIIMEKTRGWTQKLDLGRLLFQLPDAPTNGSDSCGRARLNGGTHSLQRDLNAIDFHYNVSNDFYALWLGKQMAYSCAYFEKATDDLETAQDNKFDHICRKLDLRPGDRLLDVGCGWGGLIVHAATHYGVQARGITLSVEQLRLAEKRIAEAGLSGQVSVELQDYRELSNEPAYDAVTSVGMVEHVGRKNLPLYFRKIFNVLKPGGLFMNHGIGIGPVGFLGNSGAFIQDYVFPDTDLLRIGEMTSFAEQEGWDVRDVENLRLHYAQTLREWLKRLEARRQEALQFVSQKAYRTWRLYMAGCAHNFQTARLAIYQSLLAKIGPDGTSRAPLVRAQWYR